MPYENACPIKGRGTNQDSHKTEQFGTKVVSVDDEELRLAVALMDLKVMPWWKERRWLDNDAVRRCMSWYSNGSDGIER
jgi:hypothetical protein